MSCIIRLTLKYEQRKQTLEKSQKTSIKRYSVCRRICTVLVKVIIHCINYFELFTYMQMADKKLMNFVYACLIFSCN